MNPIQLQENLTALIVKVDGLMAEYESQKLVYELGDQEASDSNYVERLIQDGFLYFDRHLFRYLRVYPYVLAEGVLTTYIAGLLQSKGGNNTMIHSFPTRRSSDLDRKSVV